MGHHVWLGYMDPLIDSATEDYGEVISVGSEWDDVLAVIIPGKLEASACLQQVVLGQFLVFEVLEMAENAG